MTAPVIEDVDLDAIFADMVAKYEKEKEHRRIPPLVRIWDGDYNLRAICKRENEANFVVLENETGTGQLDLPLDYFLTRWIADVRGRSTTNVHITVDKDGARWSGRLEGFKILKDESGRKFMRCMFKHDYEELKYILAWSNPFLPAEIQFPRLWVLFGRARWALKTTLLCNLIRLEASLWMLPDDPLDPDQWFNFDQSTWSQVVKPDTTPDQSVSALVWSRFKNMHEASEAVAADAQLTWECRRYLEGDPPPWPGANLKHGCLVWDLVDNSGWNTGTAFEGNLFSGLIHAFTNIYSDGLTESQVTVPDPAFPEDYYRPGWKGTHPSVPGIILREGELTGIKSSEFEWKPATAVGVVAGGHSMPGVNELISATVQMLGDLTAMIPGVPPVGGVADAVLKPLYTDVLLAFGKWKSPARAQRLGEFHYHEKWADGADRAYTLAWLIVMRTGMWETREYTTHRVAIEEGGRWRVGQNGHGHYYVGSRIGTAPLGVVPGEIFVDRVSTIALSWGRDKAPTWDVVIGYNDPQDPVIKAWKALQNMLSMLKDLGVL